MGLKFAASSCWYGGGGIPGTKNESPNHPVQMLFGEKGASIPMNDVAAVRAAQPKVEVYVYDGAQHGFGCQERGTYSKLARWTSSPSIWAKRYDTIAAVIALGDLTALSSARRRPA